MLRRRAKHSVRLAIGCVATLAAACGMHVPEPSPHPQDSPHLSWEIEAGTPTDAHGAVACRSEPRTPCVILATTDQQQSFATVHVYYHSSRSETKYTGTVHIGFFGGPTGGHDLKPSITVRANSAPISQAVTDVVTTKPGRYTVQISVVATFGTGRTQTIEDEIEVEVRSNDGAHQADLRQDGA